MHTLTPGLRTLAAATAVGMALTVSTTGITPAAATPVTTPTADTGTINPEAKASLTVHKRDLGADTPVEATGEADQNAPGGPLAASTFELFRVIPADLSTNSGFAAAATLEPGDLVSTDLASVGFQTTGEGGTIAFTGLDVGVYLLREIGAPAGYTPAQDSLVFLPMTTPGGSGWNYDVHVYPKNSKMTATKKVEDAGRNVGDTIRYTITSSIPNLTREGATIATYEIHDDLDETRLAPESLGGSIALDNGTVLTHGVDYEIVGDMSLLDGFARFTGAGLQKLTAAKKADSSAQVITTIEVKVTAIRGGAGVVKNEAMIISNNGAGVGDTEITTNAVESYWGKLKINKVGEDNARLNDATFQLFTCTDQGNLRGDRLTVDGKSEWTTTGEGTVTIDALQVTDHRNGTPIDAADQYCLVETKAPKGYELLPEPVNVSFTRADLTAANTNEDDAHTRVVEIKNLKSVSASLPLTGGAGIGLLAALGALIIGAGAWVARRLNRA